MIFIGIDDTDTLETPGTNQLARRIAAALPIGFQAQVVLRHQLLVDARVPCTSHNGSASLQVRTEAGRRAEELIPLMEAMVRAWCPPGSDPGLCIAAHVPAAVRAWGRRCQTDLVQQDDARSLAREHDLYLAGLGGTNGGIIGALAAVGLAAEGDDGRVVHMAGWPWPDELRGEQPLEALRARGVAQLRELATGRAVAPTRVDVGKHLRPAWRGGAPVLFVQRLSRGDDRDPEVPGADERGEPGGRSGRRRLTEPRTGADDNALWRAVKLP